MTEEVVVKVVTTISGSVYEFNDDYSLVRRSSGGDLARCLMVKFPVVGESMLFCLIDRGEGDMVYTSIVKSVG